MASWLELGIPPDGEARVDSADRSDGDIVFTAGIFGSIDRARSCVRAGGIGGGDVGVGASGGFRRGSVREGLVGLLRDRAGRGCQDGEEEGW